MRPRCAGEDSGALALCRQRRCRVERARRHLLLALLQNSQRRNEVAMHERLDAGDALADLMEHCARERSPASRHASHRRRRPARTGCLRPVGSGKDPSGGSEHLYRPGGGTVVGTGPSDCGFLELGVLGVREPPDLPTSTVPPAGRTCLLAVRGSCTISLAGPDRRWTGTPRCRSGSTDSTIVHVPRRCFTRPTSRTRARRPR